MLVKQFPSALFYAQLPLLCAVLLEVQTHLLILDIASNHLYALLSVGCLILAMPIFAAQYFAFNESFNYKFIIWLLGFIIYPLVLFFIFINLKVSEHISALLTSYTWCTLTFVSGLTWASLNFKSNVIINKIPSLSKLFTLDNLVMAFLLCWALIMSVGFTDIQHDAGGRTVSLSINFETIYLQYAPFLQRLWQFLLIASVIGIIYALNRYILIRKVLTDQGIVAFVCTSFLSILVITPLFSLMLSQLPLSNENKYLFFLSSSFAFAPSNYKFVFWILVISTPVVLVFDRQQQLLKLAHVAQQKTQTELKLLQQQIHPHFLFNTLNNLYALTLTKSNNAPTLVIQLAELLRYSIDNGQKELVPLNEEINYLKNFIALQKIRLNKHFTIDVKYPDKTQNYLISPLLMIMLVENTFKYGINSTTQHSKLTVHISLEAHTLTLECQNPYLGENIASKGIGLENLKKRLTLLYPKKHTLLSERQGQYWYAKLTLELTPC